MSELEVLLGKLKSRGEEVFSQLSGQLMSNPQFVKALQKAGQGKAVMDEAVGRGLKQMNIPTRSEFKKALARIEALERELAELKSAAKPARPRRHRPAAE